MSDVHSALLSSASPPLLAPLHVNGHVTCAPSLSTFAHLCRTEPGPCLLATTQQIDAGKEDPLDAVTPVSSSYLQTPDSIRPSTSPSFPSLPVHMTLPFPILIDAMLALAGLCPRRISDALTAGLAPSPSPYRRMAPQRRGVFHPSSLRDYARTRLLALT